MTTEQELVVQYFFPTSMGSQTVSSYRLVADELEPQLAISRIQ